MAAALRLAAMGYRVSLIDRASRLGGRAQVFERDGFRYDAGPTVITAPLLLAELFELFGKSMNDYLQLVPLAPWYRFHFPDGDVLDYGGTLEDTLAEIRRIEPADEAGYLELLEHSRKLFDAAFTQLAHVPFHKWQTMLREVPRLVSLGAHRTVWQLVCRYLRSDKLRQAFSIQPLLVGGSPFDTTSIYGLIHFLERKWGVHFAMGGTGAVVDALGRLIREVGVVVELNTTVETIDVKGNTARGVVLADGTRRSADIVVSNADPLHLYRGMVGPERMTWRGRLKMRSRLSMGLFVLYFGTRRTYPEVAHHSILFGRDFRELLDDVFHRRVLSDDVALYLHRPTATDHSFAPPGCDSFYVLCPVPNLTADIDWHVEGPRLRERIIKALSQSLLPNLERCIVADFTMNPLDFQDRYLSVAGTGFSIAPYFTQSAWFRFHNQAEGVRNLFLVGAGTHPGAGLPGVLCSAKVVAALVPTPSCTPR